MAGGTISRLAVELVANSAKFTSEMEKSRKSVDSMRDSLKLIKLDAIINLGERAFRAAGQIYNFAYSLASLGSDLTRNARTLGMTVEEYQQWQYVAKACDVESEQLMLGIRVLTKNMGDLRSGTGEAKDALARIGITAQDSNKNINELLPTIIKRLSEIGNTAEQNQLAMEIFGSRSGLAIANMVREGKNIDEITKRFKDLNLALTPEMVDKLARSEQAFKDLSALGTKLKGSFAPVVEQIAISIEKMTGSASGLQTIVNTIEELVVLGRAISEQPWWQKMLPGVGDIMGLKKAHAELDKLYQERAEKAQIAALSPPSWIKDWVKEYRPKETGGEAGILTDKQKSDIEKSVLEYNKAVAAAYSLSEAGKMPSWEDSFFSYPSRTLPDINRLNLELNLLLANTENLSEAGQMPDWRESLEIIPQGFIEINNQLYELKDITESMNIESAAWVKDWVSNWKTSGEKMTDFMKEFSSDLSSAWTTNLTNMLKGSESFSDGVKNIFKGMGDSIINTITKMITQWLLFGSITGKKEEGGGFLKGGSWSGIFGSLLGSFQEGTDYVPHTGWAKVHEGERIIPAEKNKGEQGVTYVFIEATDVNSFERKYGSVIDSRVIAGKRFNRVGMR